VNKRIDLLIQRLKAELWLILSISFSIFLFVLFFQPFPIRNFDLNNDLVFIAGFGGIVFLTIVLMRIFIPWLIRENGNSDNNRIIVPPFLKGFAILLISAVAFEFYLRYAGFVGITFFISFKVFLICLAPPVILGIYDTVTGLRQQNDLLVVEKKIVQKQVEKYEEDYLNKSVEFISENINENFNLLIAEVAFIRSADNYVEIVYKEGDAFKKKLIRNTLKNIEQQIKQYSNFLRCHRICIVNVHFIEKLNRNNESHWLTIKGLNEQLPVSRQYLLKLKEAL
jgi:DNA-binding LytR/AlgR family response regulator